MTTCNYLHSLQYKKTEHHNDAPKALILKGVYDENGAINSPTLQSIILQISKTHQVFVEHVQDKTQLRSCLQSFKSRGQKLNLLVIAAHGDERRIQFGDLNWSNFFSNSVFYGEEDINIGDFSGIDDGAKIILYSCKTGRMLAQKMASVVRRTVLAPLNEIYETSTCFLEGTLNLLSYDSSGFQHVYEFSATTSKPVSDTDEQSKRKSFAEIASYLTVRAYFRDKNAQYLLGCFHKNGTGGILKSASVAIRWLREAAIQGHEMAQCSLGWLLLKSSTEANSFNEGIEWLRRSAESGNKSACQILIKTGALGSLSMLSIVKVMVICAFLTIR